MREAKRPSLRFSATAWAKLLFLRDVGTTEVGGFGIAAAENLLLIQDLRLVKQTCTRTSVRFDDAAVANHFDACVDAGLAPEQFARVWIHSHPGECARPSNTDEETFARVFGSCDWAVMAILAQEGATYARLRFNAGPGGELVLPVEVDFTASFPATDHEAWEREYHTCVEHEQTRVHRLPEVRDLAGAIGGPSSVFDGFDLADSDLARWEFHDEHYF